MGVLSGAVSLAARGLTKVADTTTAAAGAVSGAAINGVAGAAKGAASGVRSGLESGSRSHAAAAVTLGAIGAAGLVEWPVLLTVGGAAMVIHQLGRSTGDQALPAPAATPKPAATTSAAPRAAPRKAAPRKAASSAGKTARKTTSPRRSSSR